MCGCRDWCPCPQRWSGPEKLLALDELIDRCEPSQIKYMMQVIEPQFQRDFISLLPKEVSWGGGQAGPGTGDQPRAAVPVRPGSPPAARPLRPVVPGAAGPAARCPDLPLLEGLG